MFYSLYWFSGRADGSDGRADFWKGIKIRISFRADGSGLRLRFPAVKKFVWYWGLTRPGRIRDPPGRIARSGRPKITIWHRSDFTAVCWNSRHVCYWPRSLHFRFPPVTTILHGLPQVTWYGVPSEPTCWLSCTLPLTAFSIDCGLLGRVLAHGTHSLGCEMIQLVYSHLLGNPVLRAVCSIVKFAVKIKLWLPQFAFAGWAACLNLKGYVTHQCIGSFVNASFVLSIRTLCADAFCACRGLRDYLAPCQLPMVRRNLVDPASSHMLVSKIKPCMSQYKLLYGETANGSLKQL